MTIGRDEIIAQTIFRIVSFITAAMILVVGIAILVGPLIPDYVPINYRIILGIVMVLYGGYRIAKVWLRQRNVRRLVE